MNLLHDVEVEAISFDEEKEGAVLTKPEQDFIVVVRNSVAKNASEVWGVVAGVEPEANCSLVQSRKIRTVSDVIKSLIISW